MSHRILNIALFIFIMGAYAFVMQEDYSSEMAESASLLDAQKAAQRELNRDMAAAKFCRENFGNSGMQWTVDGELVCVPRKRKS
jgi:hypothetical protein